MFSEKFIPQVKLQTSDWAPARKFDEILRQAELKYGNRDNTYAFAGIDFYEGSPSLRYPAGYAVKLVTISLTPACLTNDWEAFFEMSHEVVHLLGPHGERSASFLEEGMAVAFQGDYFQANGFQPHIWNEDRQEYIYSLAKYRELLKYDPGIIPKLRESQPITSRITADEILSICPTVPKELAELLVTPCTKDRVPE